MASRRSGSAIDGGSGASSSSLLSSNHVQFCVNPVLFENCGLLLDPASGLTTASIMKLRQESANTTSISLANWKDLAVKVLGLREATAYSVFDVFFGFSGGCMQASPSYAYGGGDGALGGKPVAEFRQENNAGLLAKMGGTVDKSRWPVASTARQVSLPGLIIFLLTQLFLERLARQPQAAVDEAQFMSHVQQYLHDYVTAVAVTRQGRVTVADSLELRILLREFVNGVEQPVGTGLGSLWPRTEKTIDIAILSQFIRNRIAAPQDIRDTAAAAGGGARGAQQQQARAAPRSFVNNMSVAGLRDRVVMPPVPSLNDPQTARLMSSNYTIEDCTQSAVYIPAALPHTRLSQLSNCTVALGPVGGVLTIDRCQNCSISALCGAVVVSNCVNVQVFVCTNTPPVLLMAKGTATVASSSSGGVGGNPTLQNVHFAPYNSHYTTLEEDLVVAGVSPKLNLWNAGLPSQAFILPPEEFTPVSFPVYPTPAGAALSTRTNPCLLPQAYQDALNRRLQRFEDVSGDLRETYAKLEADGRKDLADGLRSSVNAMFLEWLQKNGQSAGLNDLLRGSGK